MPFTEKEIQTEYRRRVALLQELMKQNGLDAVLFSSTAQQANQLCVKFFSNYMLSTRRAFIFCGSGEEPYLILPTSGQAFHAKRITWLPEDHVLYGNMMELVLKKLSGHTRVGWYLPDELPYAIYTQLCGTGICFVDVTQALTLARARKSPYEIKLTEEASRIAGDSFAHVVRMLKPGITEQELVGAAEGYLRAHGAEDSLVLTRSQKPHAFITRAKPFPIQPDGLFVYSAEIAGPGGYWTQMVRPVFMSRNAQPEAQHILEVGKKAEAAGLTVLRPGYRICDVSNIIEQVVLENGLNTGVWSGHGMGPDLGDAVDIGASNTMEIVPNMIITLHPSIVSETDGLLYGNTFLTTDSDPICLTPYFLDSPFLEDILSQLAD